MATPFTWLIKPDIPRPGAAPADLIVRPGSPCLQNVNGASGTTWCMSIERRSTLFMTEFILKYKIDKSGAFDVTTSYNSMERKNMTYAVLPRSEAFHSRLEVQARARNERQRGTVGLRVRHLSLSYLSERCVRVDSFYTIIHLHVFGKDEVQ
ncbi:jg19938 [Pararge aegeria aegeria]|uniref:Jg19938 protein n=1 Tax=Pararge aegeria aegeria TaxID=348720 RepID=A0A8S4RV63_9NEOP|nr:jg19938 [Pararge aegeria aegeria]